MIFDGRAFAQKIEDGVKAEVAIMPHKPHIVSVLVGSDPASVLYTNLKQKAAERVGIHFSVEKLDDRLKTKEIREKIIEIGSRDEVTGVMVQMPLLRQGFGGQAIPFSREETVEVISVIPFAKDVDGLRWEESGMMPATVKAILCILDKIALDSRREILDSRFVIVGSHGSVGKPLIHYLRERRIIAIEEVNSDTPRPSEVIQSGDVVISCVGKAGLIQKIKPGAIAIDVGISKVDGKVVGDMTQDVYNAASVAVPVPGGVGPVTIACLLQNAIKSLNLM